MIEVSATGSFEYRLVLLDDGVVGAASEPPFELAAMGLLIRVQPHREPECENVSGVVITASRLHVATAASCSAVRLTHRAL